MERIDPRQVLSRRLGRRPPARAAARLPAATWLETARRTTRALRQLLMPQLSSGERLQLQRGALSGVSRYLHTVNRLLASRRLQALSAEARGAAELSAIHSQLLRLLGLATELSERTEETQAQVQAELKDTIDRLEQVAARLAAEPELPAAERQAAERFSAFVRSFRARAAGQAEALRARSLRKVDRARERAAAARQDLELQRLAASLRGEGERTALTLPPTDETTTSAPARRRRVAAPQPAPVGEDGDPRPAGAPLTSCLTAPVDRYGALCDGLDDFLGQLGARAEEAGEAAAPRVDMLVEGDLAVLLLGIVDSVPFIVAEAATSREAIEELLAADEACAQAAAVAAELLRGARDGALVAAQLVMLIKEGVEAWLEAEGDDEAQALREELRAAEEVLTRSQGEKDAVLLRAERRIAQIDAELEGEQRAAAADETLRAAEAGEAVPPAELADAVRLRRDAAQMQVAARRPRARKR